MSAFQASDHQLYFVYGANMHPAQMAARCGRPEVVAVARLTGHRLAFFGHSGVWDSGEETVTPHPGGEVWGVLHRLSFADADALDSWQDVRLDGTGAYFPCPADVADAAGVRYRAVVYKKDSCREPSLPSEEFLAHIAAGATARGLPADYVERLRRMDARKAGYPVPRKDPSDRSFLLNRACTGCG